VSSQKGRQTALKNLTGAGRAAERTAVAGWHGLADALNSATGRTHHMADGTRARIGELRSQADARGREARKRGSDVRKRGVAAKEEAYRRGTAARDALAGRRSHTWRWVVLAASAGIAAGAAVAQVGRRLVRSREQAQLEKIEQTVAEATAETPNSSANGYSANPGGSSGASGAGSGSTAPSPTAGDARTSGSAGTNAGAKSGKSTPGSSTG
jgi:hypothetical protein